MVNRLFVGMIYTIMEAYVDEMFIKTIRSVNHTENLRKIFECMCLNKVSLNPVKCAFGIHSHKFLRYMVS